MSRAEFDELQKKIEQLSMIVWVQLFENSEIEESPGFLTSKPTTS